MSAYESRPKAAPEVIAATSSIVSHTCPPPPDLLALGPHGRQMWDAGYHWGYVHGHEAGVQWADDRAAAVHRAAVRVVHTNARLPEVDASLAVAREAGRKRRGWS